MFKCKEGFLHTKPAGSKGRKQEQAAPIRGNIITPCSNQLILQADFYIANKKPGWYSCSGLGWERDQIVHFKNKQAERLLMEGTST